MKEEEHLEIKGAQSMLGRLCGNSVAVDIREAWLLSIRNREEPSVKHDKNSSAMH